MVVTPMDPWPFSKGSLVVDAWCAPLNAWVRLVPESLPGAQCPEGVIEVTVGDLRQVADLQKQGVSVPAIFAQLFAGPPAI